VTRRGAEADRSPGRRRQPARQQGDDRQHPAVRAGVRGQVELGEHLPDVRLERPLAATG
jgi:hypothetical protein